MTGRTRAQLVLIAAAALAVAIAPVVLAYLQLGYHDDVGAGGDYDTPVENAERFLERAVHEAAAGTTGHEWSDRGSGVDDLRSALDPRLETLRSARVAKGTVYRTAYNASAARARASTRCPGGPDRQFGPCEARHGVVVQERIGETHVLAVALDVTVVTDRGRRKVTVVVRAVGG